MVELDESKRLYCSYSKRFRISWRLTGNTTDYSGYFTANLYEGTYAFISEIPEASIHKLLKKFKIAKKEVALK